MQGCRRTGCAPAAPDRHRSPPTDGTDRIAGGRAIAREGFRACARLPERTRNTRDCSGTGLAARTGQSWRATPPIGKTESPPPRDVGPGSWRSQPDRARRRAKKSGATQGSQEIALDGHPRLAPNRGASHQHQGDWYAQIVLMEAEGLAQQPAGARPLDRLAHLAPGHHTQLRERPARQAGPVRDETSAHNATPALADIGELTGAAKARLARQGQRRWSLDSHSIEELDWPAPDEATGAKPRPVEEASAPKPAPGTASPAPRRSARLRRGSTACVRPGGGAPGSPGLVCLRCGPENRAGVSGESSMVGIDVSCKCARCAAPRPARQIPLPSRSAQGASHLKEARQYQRTGLRQARAPSPRTSRCICQLSV